MKGTILIADQDKKKLDELEGILAAGGYKVIKASSGNDLLCAVDNTTLNLVITDIYLPGMNGLYIRAKLNERPSSMRVPILFIISKEDAEKKLRMFDIGHDDYLARPFTNDELLKQINILLKRRNYYEKDIMTDRHTGLFNASFFNKQLKLFFECAARYNETFSIALADIDRFKSINTTYGHGCGDFLLTKFVEIAKESIRRADLLTRYGGDEFGIIMPLTDENTAKSVIDRIILNTHNREFVFPEIDASIFFTVSAGIVTYDKSITTDDHLFRIADENLYAEKMKNKNASR